MTQWTLRLPEELFNWLREKAAKETIKRSERVSMNALAVEILTKAMTADQKKEGR